MKALYCQLRVLYTYLAYVPLIDWAKVESESTTSTVPGPRICGQQTCIQPPGSEPTGLHWRARTSEAHS
jgi:hypothetical protein